MVVMQLGVQQNFGAAGCSFGSETTLQLGATLKQTLSRGLWMVACSADDLVEYTPDSGTTFRTLIPAGSGGVVYSDGFNVRIRNTGVADTGGIKTFYTEILAVPGI